MKTNKLNQDGFHLIYAVLLIIVLAVAGFAIWRVVSVQQQNSENKKAAAGAVDRSDPFIMQYGTNCDDVATPLFTNAPLAVDQISYIEPMGKMNDGHVTPTDHVYVAPLNPDAADNSYNVVMPADGKVVMVAAMPASYIGDREQQTAAEDHRIVVSFNCRYYSIFIHVHQLSDKLKQEVGKLEPNTSKQTNISLKAGEPIGKIGGSPVDWTMVDAKTNLPGFISPELYEGEPWKVHTIDPFSMYTGTLRSQLQNKSLRSATPIGGKIDYDRTKTLQGNWFRSGTNGYMGSNKERYWDGHLAVVPDAIDPESTIVSIGNWEGKAAQFTVKGRVDPGKVNKENSPVKYELIKLGYVTPEGSGWTGRSYVANLKPNQNGEVIGTIMIEVQDNEKIRVEKFPGLTAGQVNAFSANAEIFER